MNVSASLVRAHYAPADQQPLLSRLLPFVQSLPADEAGRRQLAALDHFHVRGAAATAELAALAGLKNGERVLDAGSGLGGPSRYLARTFGCDVTGVDLTPDFVEVATHLAEQEGLSARVRYQVADMRELPFASGSFDLIWTEHALMNVQERDLAYREFRRILRPRGRVAFYEPVAVDEKDVIYPVPWAASPVASFLLTQAHTTEALGAIGFTQIAQRDVTAEAVAALGVTGSAPPGSGLSPVMGARFSEMAANFARNLAEGRVRLIMGVAHR